MSEGNQPVVKLRIGNITAAVWKNDSGFFSVTLQRSYKDEIVNEETGAVTEGWKQTDNLGHQDLLNAAKVLERAEDYISRNTATR